jgi:hypothetical protein
MNKKEALFAVYLLQTIIFNDMHNDEKQNEKEIICKSIGNNKIEFWMAQTCKTFSTSSFYEVVEEPIKIQNIRNVMQTLQTFGWKIREEGTFKNKAGEKISFFIETLMTDT